MHPSIKSVVIGKGIGYIHDAVVCCIFSFLTFLGLSFWGFKYQKSRFLAV